MPTTHPPVTRYRVETHARLDEARERCERELLDAGVPLALPHRTEWAEAMGGRGTWLLAARGPGGEPQCAAGVQLVRSRALPGYLLARVERFGAALSPGAREATLHALADWARRHPRVLRLHVETYSPEPEVLEGMGALLGGLGFVRQVPGRCYDHTVTLDVTPDEAALLASLHSTARYNIRFAQRKPVEVRPVEDAGYAPRLDALLAETLARTGGTPHPHDWRAIMSLSARHPRLSRLAGLFRTDRDGPESLLAFAWGCAHGDHAQYSTAASTRDTDLRMPLAYPVVWDLIRWARGAGARYFDFGGISGGTLGDGQDPLGGISDFKRYFTTHRVRVGEEWVLEPHRVPAAIARAASAGLSRLRLLRA